MVLAATAVWRALGSPGTRHPRRPPDPSAGLGGPQPGSGEPADAISPELVYEHFCKGRELLDSGNPAQAAVRLEKARAAEPTKASIREALGRAYFSIGRWEDAEAEFRAVVAISPTDDYAHYCLARSLRRQGRPREADVHHRLSQALGRGRPPETR